MAGDDHRVERARVQALLDRRADELRVAAGLTQTDIAGDRFSKEYISQIERGKTRPTAETVDWLALRLGVDAGFLASGVSDDERAKAETILTRADTLSQEHRFAEAIEEYTRALPAVLGTGAAELRVRALNGEAMAHAQSGDVKTALALQGRMEERFRLPLCEIGKGSREKLVGVLRRHGLVG